MERGERDSEFLSGELGLRELGTLVSELEGDKILGEFGGEAESSSQLLTDGFGLN